jgi:hypothetical protein
LITLSSDPSRTVRACSIAFFRAVRFASAAWIACCAGSRPCLTASNAIGPYRTPYFTRFFASRPR